MTLYFEDRDYKRTVIGHPKTLAEAHRMISEDSVNHAIAAFYVRSWDDGDDTYFDIGLWSEYYVLSKNDE